MQEWSTLITAIVGVIVALGGKEIIQGLINKHNGKAQEERARVREATADAEKLRAKLNSTYDRLERQISANRVQKEYSSTLRRIMIEAGIPKDKIPDWPN